MEYKLIAADMDGTLLDDNSRLSERTKSAIAAAVKAGALFVTATGRPMRAAENVNELFKEDLPFIVFNGVAAVMGKKKDILFASSLGQDEIKQIYNEGISKTSVIMWTTGEELWASEDCEATREYRKISGAKLNIIDKIDDIAKCGIAKMMWIDEPEKITYYQREMAEKLKGRVNFYASRPAFLEFVDAKSSKGAALRKIGEILHIAQSEMIAVGDSDNDISMLEYAGLGVAMGNASEAVKSVCQEVTLSNNEDGVAAIIEKYFLKNKN